MGFQVKRSGKEGRSSPDAAGRKLKSKKGNIDYGIFKNRTKYSFYFEIITVLALAAHILKLK